MWDLVVDPHLVLDPLGWTDDAMTVALLGTSAAVLLLVILCIAFWVTKSRHRAEQRFERRNSIRASIRSSRSFNSLASSSTFIDTAGTRHRKPLVPPNGRGLNGGGSVDSIEKSHQFESSVEDNRSFDIYEAHEHHPANNVGLPTAQQGFSYSQLDHRATHQAGRSAVSHHPSGQLTFENQGFRDTSTYASHSASRAPSDYWGDSSSIDAQSTHTASVSVHHNGVVSYQQPQPGRSGQESDYSRVRSRSEAGVLDSYSTASGVTDSTLAMKRELDDSDAASAITLPQQRRPAMENRNPPLINKYKTSSFPENSVD